MFEASRETYGYRRVHAQLLREGIEAGPELVRALMRELGLEPCQPSPSFLARSGCDAFRPGQGLFSSGLCVLPKSLGRWLAGWGVALDSEEVGQFLLLGGHVGQ